MTSSYFLKLNQFEGPLDLLLHLIKVNEIDIFNIDIFLLTSQYLEHLRLIKFDDIADAGDFLEMAATLIEIKSRMLLPNEKTDAASQDDAIEDPRLSLQNRLIEYEKIRNAANHLYNLPQLGVDIQTNHEWQRLLPFYEDCESPLTGDPTTLIVLYEQMLKDVLIRKGPAKHEAKTHQVTVEEKIDELMKLLETVNFALFQGFYKKFRSRYELIVYLLAILEMVKIAKIKLYQAQTMGPLWLYRYDFNENELPLSIKEKERIIKNVHELTEEI